MRVRLGGMFCHRVPVTVPCAISMSAVFDGRELRYDDHLVLVTDGAFVDLGPARP